MMRVGASYLLDLHILELFYPVPCVALANLSKSLVLVTSLLHVFQMEKIEPRLLGIVPACCKVRGQRLHTNEASRYINEQ